MKFYRPKFLIASLQAPQETFRNKFGGLPWGLPLERWRRCQECGRLMSLLAQLRHDPPALDLGGPDYVLHLFQCQVCFGYESRSGNDATIERFDSLGHGLTQIPDKEDLAGMMAACDGGLVGELWIDGWEIIDDGLDSTLATSLYDQKQWMNLPKTVCHSMFESRWRTKMGGIPYWTGNGPQQKLIPDYEFLFQFDEGIEFAGTPPTPDELGGMVITTELAGEGANLRIVRQECHRPDPAKKKINAPWNVVVNSTEKEKYFVSITNLGTDGTAYIFINRNTDPPDIYWYWNR